jgi:hypothetical protein
MRLRPALSAVLAAALAGCGAERVVVPAAPHGGTFVGLPDGLGRVEIVRRGATDKPDHARLLLYFFGPDDKPITPAPTSATLEPKERKGKAVAFKPAADTGPSNAGALESPQFDTGGDIAGEL